MSDLIQKYVQSWLPKDTNLLPYYIGIDSVLESLLEKKNPFDIDEISPKIIADPLLGYIHLEPLEVCIVDTKLFQRLRKVKQLGLAYLVFPSLGYSRFEHSLGVLGRLEQILNKLIENNLRRDKEDDLRTVINKYKRPLRLAALLHDMGHCLFSHCSERVIEKCKGSESYPSATVIQEILTKHFKKEKRIPMAEIFSLSIIGSKKFLDFLESLSFSTKKDIEKTLKQTARFIVGLPIEEDADTVFLAQLISGGLDADKIDYMLREQQYSGIKLEIDVDRILSKLRIFSLKSYELPNQLSHLKNLYEPEATIKVLGFEKGGQFAFEEFCIARLALHVKVYLHQKVRAAEAQLSKYLEILLDSPILKEVHNWLKLPEAIIEYPEIVNQRFASDGTLFNLFALHNKILVSFKKIDERDISHRSYAFGPINSYSEGLKKTNENYQGEFDQYFELFKDIDLKTKIIEDAIQICDEHNIEIDHDKLEDLIVEVPKLLNIQQGHESLYFERANYLPVRWTIPIDKILVYFQENRALAYVFSPKEISHIIAAISEKVIFDISEKVYSQANHLSRKTHSSYQNIKAKLNSKGFYNKYPQLKPISEYLKMAAASEKISKIHENLKGFRSVSDEYITINRITTFVNQFPEELQDACLCFLDHLEIYNEGLLVSELDKILSKIISEDNSVAICPLGSATDSGNRLNYHLREVFEKFNIDKADLNDNVILENDKVIFFDDNINSGLQLINIFAEILDKKASLPSDLQLDEKHHRKLVSVDAKEKFMNMPISIAYIVGMENSAEKVKDTLSKYLGFDPKNICIRIHKTFKEKDKILTGENSAFNHEKKKEFRDALSEIGEKLLQNEKKAETKIQSCKIGYSNAQAMVLFPYNVPTMTVTALWCKGVVDGIPWIPLAERRRRSNKEGKFIGED